MKIIIPLLAGLLAATQPGCSSMSPHHHAADAALPSWKDGALARPDPAWFAKVVADYPLTTCVVSGDKLDGTKLAPTDFVVRQAGQPDRLVRFCCADCQKDFAKDPAQYLKKIDEAAAAKARAASAAK